MTMSGTARIAVVVVVTAAGALAVVGSGLALLSEVQGFGVPRDTAARTGHLVGTGPACCWESSCPAQRRGCC